MKIRCLIHYFGLPLLLVFSLFLNACDQNGAQATSSPTENAVTPDSIGFRQALRTHLDAVIHKDFTALKATLPDSGAMHLILPNGAMMVNVKDFLDMHKEWFQDTTWTMQSDIVYTDNGMDYGYGIVRSTYREPERDGKPYENKMYITYDLKKMDGKWVVVKDHASSIAKTE